MHGARTDGRGMVVLAASTLLLALQPAPVHAAVLVWSSADAGGEASSSGSHRLGATVGQGDATISSAADAELVGGFWAIVRADTAAPTPTASPTLTPSAITGTATASISPTPTATGTGGVATATATHTVTPGASPTATPLPTTVSPSATPTPTATPPTGCVGDCNGDGEVRVDELVTLVNIALDLQTLDACPTADRNGDGRVTIDEVLLAVTHALNRCPPEGELS